MLYIVRSDSIEDISRMNLLTFRGTVSTFHREEVERRTNGGYTGGGISRSGSQLSRANIGHGRKL